MSLDDTLKPDSQAQTWEKTTQDPLATTRTPLEAIVGTTLNGRYRIQRKLGHGGFGVVYLAADEKMLSRPVVVKALADDGKENDWIAKKFKQEIEALARIDHPSIVGIFDVGEMPDGKPYIVMQYVDGFSLRSLISPEGLDFWRAANIVRQTGRALSAAHDRGILHRDLKPENIMVQTLGGGDEQVKIIDFGIARVKNSVVSFTTASDKTVGTIAYMSPEQLIAAKLTPASDVYCLAVIAYELLTGRRPNNPETGYQLREMQEAGVRIKPRDLRPGLPEEAEAIILKALSFKAEMRPQRARDFGDFLAAALTDDDEHTVLASAAAPLLETVTEVPPAHATPVVEPTGPTAGASSAKQLGTIAAVAIVSGLLSVALAYFVLIPRSKEAGAPASLTAANTIEQSFTYSLTVQKMRDGKPDGGELEMAGSEIYGNGWKFRFNVWPAQKGAFYLLNETVAAGAPEFNALFPTPQNGGTAAIAANQRLQTRWYVFDKQPGVEKLWIIWSDKPVAELDQAFDAAAKQDGVLNSSQAATVQSYIARYDEDRVEVKPDKPRKQTVVKGKGELFVQLLELNHEPY
jgi:hypothetical protein